MRIGMPLPYRRGVREAGALFGTRDKPVAVIGFTITGGRIVALNLIAGHDKLRNLTIQVRP